jgi:hypothetical protein
MDRQEKFNKLNYLMPSFQASKAKAAPAPESAAKPAESSGLNKIEEIVEPMPPKEQKGILEEGTCGLYYKSMTIVNDDSRVVNKLEASLTDNTRVVIYERHMFIVQATVL